MRRYLMAAGTSLMVIVLLWVAYALGGLDWDGVVQGTRADLVLGGALLPDVADRP